MAKFETGQVVETQGVNRKRYEDKNFEQFVRESFQRHLKGDWGDLCEEDKKSNDNALITQDRLLSKYNYNDGTSIYIITEWDRSATTVLFPSEY
jgi:hypothetical protein